MKFCKKCVMPDTRPRTIFNGDGICSACQHDYNKKHVIDWGSRKRQLEEILDRHRSKDGRYDVVVPGSGGKDSGYVTYKLKHDYGMHPLTVTFGANGEPTDIGRKNLSDFIASGYDNILVSPNEAIRRKLVRNALIKFGDVFQPFIYGQDGIPMRMAVNFGIKLVFFGENGEVEYGGDASLDKSPFISEEVIEKYYRSGFSVKQCMDPDMDIADVQPYLYPTTEELRKSGVKYTHWSYFEDWRPYDHYLLVKEKTGYLPKEDGLSEGTYTNYASLDDRLDGIHYYFMFLKFGFARATSDACHEIREGLKTREEAVKLVEQYDDNFPKKEFKYFLDYCRLSEDEFWTIVDSFANKTILDKRGKYWKLKEEHKLVRREQLNASEVHHRG